MNDNEIISPIPDRWVKLLGWAFSVFVSVAIAAHKFPDSEFYSDFKFWAGAVILLIVVLGSLVIVAALTHALFRAAIGLLARGD